jgi:hypothetical protein
LFYRKLSFTFRFCSSTSFTTLFLTSFSSFPTNAKLAFTAVNKLVNNGSLISASNGSPLRSPTSILFLPQWLTLLTLLASLQHCVTSQPLLPLSTPTPLVAAEAAAPPLLHLSWIHLHPPHLSTYHLVPALPHTKPLVPLLTKYGTAPRTSYLPSSFACASMPVMFNGTL